MGDPTQQGAPTSRASRQKALVLGKAGTILLTQPDRQCHQPAWKILLLYLAHKDTTGENFSKRLTSQKEYILGPKSDEN